MARRPIRSIMIKLGALLFILLLAACSYSNAFSFNVDATREECFVEDIFFVGIPVSVMFQVTQGGFLDIDIRVCNVIRSSVIFCR